MKQLVAVTLVLGLMVGVASLSGAQQTGPTSPPAPSPAQSPGSSGGVGASQSGGASGSAGGHMATIDCPSSAAMGSSGTSGAGASGAGSTSPSVSGGAGTTGSASGSAGSSSSYPSVSGGAGTTGSASGSAGTQRVEGEIKNLDPSGRSFEIQNVKLKLDPSSSILVDCKKATMIELREGAKVKAAYEVRNGENFVTVIEAEKQ